MVKVFNTLILDKESSPFLTKLINEIIKEIEDNKDKEKLLLIDDIALD